MRFFEKNKLFFLSLLLISCGHSAAPIIDDNVSLIPEKNEQLSGGSTTVNDFSQTAFNQFAANLTFAQQSKFKIGNSFFEQDWVTAPASTTARDGLGPFFHANSCASCHAKDGRGAPPLSEGLDISIKAETAALLFRLSVQTADGPKSDFVYGDQFQPKSISGVKPEGDVFVDYIEVDGQFDDGVSYSLLTPSYRFENLNYGPMHPDVLVSPRIASQMTGMGLLEAISEEDLLAYADPEDKDVNGISGRLNFVWDEETQSTKIGRFGWKANQPSVKQQVAGAFNGDVGITSNLFPVDHCTESQIDCLGAINGGDPELSDDVFDSVVFYSQTLGVPGRRNWDKQNVLNGKSLFNQIGCASCHVPSYVTSDDHPIKELRNQKIFPYTDLLLHDMGPGLADGRPDFMASGFEWRTPPLWGIGLINTVNGHTRFLHDGRARNLTEAILWHGGEANKSVATFKSLSREDRQDLIDFLNSL